MILIFPLQVRNIPDSMESHLPDSFAKARFYQEMGIIYILVNGAFQIPVIDMFIS